MPRHGALGPGRRPWRGCWSRYRNNLDLGVLLWAEKLDSGGRPGRVQRLRPPSGLEAGNQIQFLVAHCGAMPGMFSFWIERARVDFVRHRRRTDRQTDRSESVMSQPRVGRKNDWQHSKEAEQRESGAERSKRLKQDQRNVVHSAARRQSMLCKSFHWRRRRDIPCAPSHQVKRTQGT